MNRIASIVFGLCLMLSMTTVSFANTQSFKHFSVDVPQGWEAAEDGEVVSILAPGHALPQKKGRHNRKKQYCAS